tara:strand:+ start:4671 stop:5306 length:636 start_codon:yes stop_codon:yes gene_type:complete
MALSDDGFVGQIISRKAYIDSNDRQKDYIRAPWGYVFYKFGGKTLFNVQGRKSNSTLSGKPPSEVFCSSKRMRLLAKVYARVQNKREAIRKIYGEVDKNRRFKLSTSMESKYFKKMVKEETDKLLDTHGFTGDYVMELLKDTIEMAKTKKDVGNLMKAVDNLQDLHGMKDKKTQVDTRQIEVTSTKTLIDAIEEQENKLIATETTTKEVDE